MKKNFYAAMLGAGLLLTGCQNQRKLPKLAY